MDCLCLRAGHVADVNALRSVSKIRDCCGTVWWVECSWAERQSWKAKTNPLDTGQANAWNLPEDAPLNGGHGPYHPLEPEGGWPCETTPAISFAPMMLRTGESWKGHKGREDLGRESWDPKGQNLFGRFDANSSGSIPHIGDSWELWREAERFFASW